MRLLGPLCLPAVGPPCLTRQQLSAVANTPLASPQRSGFLAHTGNHNSLRTETCMRVRNKQKLHQKDTCTAILTHVNDVEKRVNVPHYCAFCTRCQPSNQLCRASPCRWQRRLAEPLVLQTQKVSRCSRFTLRSRLNLLQHCAMCRRNGIVVRCGMADRCEFAMRSWRRRRHCVRLGVLCSGTPTRHHPHSNA